MAFKRPFGKVRKIEKKQQPQQLPVEKNEQKPENQSPQNQIVSKTPLFSLGSKKTKLLPPSKNIYDALKKNENNEQAQTQTRQSISLRPDLLKKKTGRKLIGTPQKDKQVLPPTIQEEPSNNLQVPKPTPLFHGRKNHLSNMREKQKQRVIIEQQQGNFEKSQDFQEQSNNQQEQSVHKRPDLKLKKKFEKTPRQKAIIDIDQQKFARRQQQIKPVYIPIQPTLLNIEKKEENVSQAKIQKQRIRTKDLKQLLNLECDLYEQLISLSCMTEYQVYINKIKSDFIRNSIDQAFDEKSTLHTQTLSFQFMDFANQCPQDYLTNVNALIQTDESQAVDSFILKIAPIIEQLIRPSTQIIMPPVFLLAFKPQFHTFTKCPYPLFIYYNDKLGIAVAGQKLYISQGKINAALSLGPFLIGGLQNGKIVVWSGKNDKRSKLYRSVFETIQSTNFQLPSISNSQLDKYSLYRSDGKIVSLINIKNNQFASLDEHGKFVHWCIEQKQNQEIILKGLKQFDFSAALQNKFLITSSIKFRKDKYFIKTSHGILVWNGEEIIQSLNCENYQIIQFELPKRSNWVYAICSDNSLRIFDENYSKQAFSMFINSKGTLVNIIIPEVLYFNQQIAMWSHFYITDSKGSSYEINLQQNLNEEVMIIQSHSTGRDIIFQGVNGVGNTLEIISLYQDLKCKKQLKQMNVNLQASKQNLKQISQANRYIAQLLTEDSVIF